MSIMRLISIFILLIQLIACGGGDDSSPSEVDVNLSPTASAGEDQTVQQQILVTLSGTGIDSDGTITTFSWRQTEGAAISLSADNSDIVNFTSPILDVTETLTFELTVIDNEGASSVDTINIVVSKPQEISGIVLDYKTGLGIPNTAISASHFIDGVSTQLGDTLSATDGSFLILYYQPTIGRINLTANTSAYAEHSVVVESNEDVMAVNSNISLLPVNVSQFFDVNNNVSIEVEGQSVISISGGSLEREDGEAIKGLVTGEVTVIDASTDTGLMPGDFLAIDSGNFVNQIESFGALNITFVDEEGNELNLKEGESAQINIPISNNVDPITAPVSVPLFYYDEEKGYWIEEGVSTLTELETGVFAYVGTVSHFTTWNADDYYIRSFISGCFQDEFGSPMPNFKVNSNGKDYIGSSSARTDNNGEFKIAVKSNSKVTLSYHFEGLENSFDFDSLDTNQELIINSCFILIAGPINPSTLVPRIRFTTAELYGNSFNVSSDVNESYVYNFSSDNTGTWTFTDGSRTDFTWYVSATGVLVITTPWNVFGHILTSGNASSGTLTSYIDGHLNYSPETISKVAVNIFTSDAIVGKDFRVTFGALGSVIYHFESNGIGTINDGDGISDCTWRISAGSLIVTTEDDIDTYTLTAGNPSSGTLDIHIVSTNEGILDEKGTIVLIP